MSTDASLLEGIRVLEVATFVFGPAAGTVLGDFGADVVKVEHPATGDPYRYLHQLAPLPVSEVDYCWILDSRNKRSIAIDLKSEKGHALVVELARRADVFITNFHPSVLADLKIRYEDLAPENERLVYAHATGYGEVGDEVEKPGYDATAWWARSGLMDAVRNSGGDPALAVAGMGDHPSALALLSGIALALYARERSGLGTKVSTSLLANGAWANGIYLQAALCGAAPYEAPGAGHCPNALVTHYATGDGRRLYLAMVQEAVEWRRFCEAIARPELLTDPRFAELEARRANALALQAILVELFSQKTQPEWREILDRHGVTFGVISRTQELPDDEQLIANGVLRELDDPRHPGLRTVDSPVWLEGALKRPASRAPEIGEHTSEILGELGYDARRIAALAGEGIVRLR